MSSKKIDIPVGHLKHLISEDVYLIDNQVRKEPLAQSLKEQLLVISESLGSSETETLNKLLQAIKMDPAGVRIVQKWPDDYDTHARVIIFGDHPNEEYKALNFNEVHQLGGQQILRTKSISQLDADRNQKLGLWEALKSWFQI